MTPASRPAFSFSARYDVSTSRCIAVHRPDDVDVLLGHARENQLIAIGAGDVEPQLRPLARAREAAAAPGTIDR